MSQQPPSNLVTVTIDGREARVPRGMILVDAAATVGIDIPVFCYHEKLKPVGACRMCMVQIAPANRLGTACTTMVNDGMIVTTASELVRQGREQVLELLLANHPLDCPVCDKGGECPLQDNTFGYGPTTSNYLEPKRRYEKPVDLSHLIKLDRERCILCYRCTRFADEIAGDQSLTVLERGSHSEIGLAEGRVFDSAFSGNVTELCPVGALTSSLYRFRARPWDIVSVNTICPHCAVGCNVTVQTRKTTDQVVRVLARENTPVDDGWLCDFGRYNYDYLNAETRLTRPMLRRNGRLEPVSWDEALSAVADRLKAIVADHGGAAVGGIAAPTQTNEELYLFQKLFRLGLNSPNIDHRVDGAAYTAAGDYDAGMGSIAALERAGAILLVDVEAQAGDSVLALRLIKATGKNVPVLAIQPAAGLLTRRAKGFLKAAPDQHAPLVAALLASVIAQGKAVEGFAPSGDVAALLARTDVAATAKTANVDEAAITRMAERLAAAGPGKAAILYRRDATALAGGNDLLTALRGLAAAIGATSEHGLGLHGLVRDANEQGALDMGVLPTHLPGHRSVSDTDAAAALSALWGGSVPTEAGLDGAAMLDAAANGQLKGLFLLGASPRGLAATAERFASAIANVDFLVVQDIAAPAAVLEHAAVVLPGAAFTEKDGTFTNLERRVQRLRLGLTSPGEARADWRILRDLGSRIAPAATFAVSTPRETLMEIGQAVALYSGITYGRVGSAGLQWPSGLAAASESNVIMAASAAPQG